MARLMILVCMSGMFFLVLACLADGPATQPGNDAASPPWKKLYENEQWYKDAKQKEQIFTGTLQLHAEPEMGISMRPHRYELGDRLIYPDTKNPVLESLIGQKVEIRGKANDEELEGSNLKEIWPGAIRAVIDAPPTTGPATNKGG